jgi:hypothetical protein
MELSSFKQNLIITVLGSLLLACGGIAECTYQAHQKSMDAVAAEALHRTQFETETKVEIANLKSDIRDIKHSLNARQQAKLNRPPLPVGVPEPVAAYGTPAVVASVPVPVPAEKAVPAASVVPPVAAAPAAVPPKADAKTTKHTKWAHIKEKLKE